MKRIITSTYGSTDHDIVDVGGNKKKGKRKMSESNPYHPDTSMTSTATPEGEKMLQYLNSLNPLEYAQFEAHRRCTFRADLISKFVASCLVQNERERFAHRANAKDFLHSHNNYTRSVDPKDETITEKRLSIHPPQRYDENTSNGYGLNLDDLVDPHAAPEITIVVSSLAKSYAQRLIQASRSLASSQGYDEMAPLLPSHILNAHRQRSQNGLDPGFFLQPSLYQNSIVYHNNQMKFGIGKQYPTTLSFISNGSDVLSQSHRSLKPLAALASQEMYDEIVSNISIASAENGEGEDTRSLEAEESPQ